MSTFIGRQADIGIAKEGVRGTVQSPSFWVPKTDLTYDEQVNQVVDESSVSVIEDSIDARVTEKFTEGSVEGLVRDKSFGLLLLSTLGAVSTTPDDPEVGVNTHEFSVQQDAQSPSLTIHIAEPNGDKSFPLAMVNELTIDVEVQEFVRFTAGFRSKKGESASLTPAYSSENHFVPQYATFKTATDLAGLGAAPEIKINRWSMTISKNVEDDMVLGSVDPNDINNKQLAIEGEVELIYRDTTFVDELLADTAKAMRLSLVNSDVTIGSSSNPTIEIDLARVKFSAVTKPFANDDIVRQTVSFKGFYSLSDSKSITIKLINTQTSY